MTKEFLWRIAGGDCELLEISGEVSQRNFKLIGLLYLLINFIVYTAVLGMFYGIFKSLFTSVLGALVFGFLITNIYRLNLMSLEPRTLPVILKPGSLISSHIIRYLTISLFAIFVSKNFEMLLVNFFEELKIITYSGSQSYLVHLKETNLTQPWLWFVTTAVSSLFIIPIYLKHRLHRSMEYYSIKERRDIRLVIEDYQKFKTYYKDKMSEIYSEYREVNDQREYSEPKKIFSDEPFNTKRLIEEPDYKSGSDFINDILYR